MRIKEATPMAGGVTIADRTYEDVMLKIFRRTRTKEVLIVPSPGDTIKHPGVDIPSRIPMTILVPDLSWWRSLYNWLRGYRKIK